MEIQKALAKLYSVKINSNSISNFFMINCADMTPEDAENYLRNWIKAIKEEMLNNRKLLARENQVYISMG